MYPSSKIIIQSDEYSEIPSHDDIENGTNENILETTIVEEENYEPQIRSRRSILEHISETTYSLSNRLYLSNKKHDKQSKKIESDYDIEAGISLIKEIILKEKGTKKYLVFCVGLIFIGIILFMFCFGVKGFYDETSIE